MSESRIGFVGGGRVARVLGGGQAFVEHLKRARQITSQLQRSYGCGISAGSRNLLIFRSATLGYIDLTGSRQTENYGGIRPGCWVNAIPAGGLLLMADAAS